MLGFTKLLAYAPRTADANGTSLDTQNSDDVLFVFDVGAAADTLSGSVYLELELEESDDNSVWNDAPSASISNPAAGSTNTGTAAKITANADANKLVKVAYIGNKRYVRPVVNITGTHTNGTPVGVFAVRGRNRYAPAA